MFQPQLAPSALNLSPVPGPDNGREMLMALYIDTISNTQVQLDEGAAVSVTAVQAPANKGRLARPSGGACPAARRQGR
jgi:hypothetical protein